MNTTETAIGVIPARYGSTRFPGKPLVPLRGKSMIQRVYERARQASRLSRVLVATDDVRIETHVREFGGEVMMTRSDHGSGTERLGEVAGEHDAAYWVNIQGDEPLVDPDQIDRLLERLQSGADIATLVCPIREVARFRDPNVVKAVLGFDGQALYFSRAPIPWPRGGAALPPAWQHIGVYAFRQAALARALQLPAHPLEAAEQLEQLRWLAHGMAIGCLEVAQPSLSVDIPEDVAAVEAEIDRREE